MLKTSNITAERPWRVEALLSSFLLLDSKIEHNEMLSKSLE